MRFNGLNLGYLVSYSNTQGWNNVWVTAYYMYSGYDNGKRTNYVIREFLHCSANRYRILVFFKQRLLIGLESTNTIQYPLSEMGKNSLI